MSGADLEYQAMLARAGVDPAAPAGYDAARLEQMRDSNEGGTTLNTQELTDLVTTGRLSADDLNATFATTPDQGTEVGPGARAIGKGELAINVADYDTGPYLVGGVEVGRTIDISEVIKKMELFEAACYVPPGNWWPDEVNVALDETYLVDNSFAWRNRFSYLFFGAGRHSRLRLPTTMVSGDWLFIGNKEGLTNSFHAHPKVTFENLGFMGGENGQGGLYYGHGRSFAAIRVYLANMLNGFKIDQYTDQIRLQQVHAESFTPGGWVYEGVDNGPDGLVIDQLHAHGLQAVKLRGCYGGQIRGAVSGFYDFTACAVTFTDCHMEGDGSTASTPMILVKGSTVALEGGFFQTKPYRPTIQIDDTDAGNNRTSQVFLSERTIFAQRLDDPGSSLGNAKTADIHIVSLGASGQRGKIVNRGAQAWLYGQSTSLGGTTVHGKAGIVALMVTSDVAAITTELTNRKGFLAGPWVLQYAASSAYSLRPPNPGHLIYPTRAFSAPSVTLISNSGEYTAYGTDMAAGTYYYRAAVLDPLGRSSAAAAEVSRTTTSTANDKLIGITTGVWEPGNTLRLWRGTSPGVYDRYVDITLGPLSQTLIDQGSKIAGQTWLTTSIPAVPATGYAFRGTYRFDTGRSRLAGTAAPTAGTWIVGDTMENEATAEAGSVGSKYIITGWACTVAGTPGTWLNTRSLTGN